MSEQAITPPRILPPHYFAGSVGLILVLTFAMPQLFWVGRSGLLSTAPYPQWMAFTGILPMLVGVIIAVGASRQFSAVDTNIIPLTRSTTLVTDGMFRFSRNPMYLGMLLFLSGLVFLTHAPLGWVVVIGFFLIIRQRFVLKEEALMVETFGDEYAEYQTRVRRWI